MENKISDYDKIIGSLHDRNDVVQTKSSTFTVVVPVVGTPQTYTVQTYRERDVIKNKKGREHTIYRDTISLQMVGSDSLAIRIAIPPKVADTIIRQRESLSSTVRTKNAKANAQARKDRGELPGFMKPKPAAA
jgi:hypothetical protein